MPVNMRADNNWEDKVGKRLFDVEGELSPQAWENISRRIAQKPKRRPLWYWLPALLLFVALPLAFYLGNTFKHNPSEVSQNELKNAAGNAATRQQETGQLKGQKPATQSTTPKEEPAQIPAKNEIADQGKNNSEQVDSKQEKAEKFTAATNGTHVKILPPVKENKKPEIAAKAEKSLIAETKKPAVNILPIASYNTRKPVKKSLVQAENTKNGTEKTKETPKAKKPVIASLIPANKLKNIGDKNEIGKNKPEGKTDNNLPIVPVMKAQEPEIFRSETVAETKGNESVIAAGNTSKGEIISQDSVKKEIVSALMPATPDSTTKENKPAETKTKKPVSWSIYGTPQYTFQRVFANTSDDVMILSMTNKNDFETERFGYEFGFRGQYPLNEKIQLEVGAQFARINHHIKFRTASTIADSVVINQQPGQLTLEIRNREQNEVLLFKYFFGGLYSGLNYHLGKGWKISGGIGANWLLWKNPDEEQIPIPTRSLNPYFSAGLRYQVVLSEKVMLQAGPTLQYFIKPVQKESAHYGAKPTTVGFTVGLLFNGNK